MLLWIVFLDLVEVVVILEVVNGVFELFFFCIGEIWFLLLVDFRSFCVDIFLCFRFFVNFFLYLLSCCWEVVEVDGVLLDEDGGLLFMFFCGCVGFEDLFFLWLLSCLCFFDLIGREVFEVVDGGWLVWWFMVMLCLWLWEEVVSVIFLFFVVVGFVLLEWSSLKLLGDDLLGSLSWCVGFGWIGFVLIGGLDFDMF